MKKKIDPKISEYYRELAKKGVKARHAKLLAKLDKNSKSVPKEETVDN